MKIQQFDRKTFRVDAVRVTLENMPQVVKWTGGNLLQDDLHRPYVSVEVSRPANVKQTMAYEGDWVLKTATGFRIYTDFAFKKSFDPVKKGQQNVAKNPRVDPYQTGHTSPGVQNVFDRPDVDRTVVESPVGDEKVIQGESVETVVVPNPVLEDVARRAGFRTPAELREAHRTGKIWSDGTDVKPEDLDPSVPKASDGRHATYLAKYYAEHGHYPAENPDQPRRFVSGEQFWSGDHGSTENIDQSDA